MTHEQTPASSEVRELLREIDRDPTAALTALASRVRGSRLWKRRNPIRRATLAADDLARMHRDEVAILLGEMAQREQHEEPYWRGLLHGSLRVGESITLPTRAELQSRARSLQHGDNGADEAAASKLAAFYRPIGDRSERPILRTALASRELLKSDQSALLAAHEYIRFGEWAEARRLIEEVTRHPLSNLHCSFAWECMGVLELRRGRIQTSAEAFNNAADADPERPTPLISSFVVASSAGLTNTATRAAIRVEDLVAPDDEAVRACVRAFLELRARQLFTATLHPEVDEDHVVQGPTTNRIRNALL